MVSLHAQEVLLPVLQYLLFSLVKYVSTQLPWRLSYPILDNYDAKMIFFFIELEAYSLTCPNNFLLVVLFSIMLVIPLNIKWKMCP